MDRRSFIRNTGFVAASLAIVPASSAKIIANPENYLFLLKGGVRPMDMLRAWSELTRPVSARFVSGNCRGFHDKDLTHRNGLNSFYNSFGIYKTQPEAKDPGFNLKVVDGFDCAHHDIDRYHSLIINTVNEIVALDLALQTELFTPDYRIIVTTEIGRNNFHNDHGGLDHWHDSAGKIFYMTMGSGIENFVTEEVDIIHPETLLSGEI